MQPFFTPLAYYTLTTHQLRDPKSQALQLLTAPLTEKLILDGVTRRSVLDLAHERLSPSSKALPSDIEPLEIVERTYTMLEVEEAQKEGRIVEAFLSGTAVSFPLFSSRPFPLNRIHNPNANGNKHTMFHPLAPIAPISSASSAHKNWSLPPIQQYFITPVSAISFRDRNIEIPMQNAAGDSGVYAQMIKTWLYDIMYGNVEHEWGVVVDEDQWLQCYMDIK